MEFMISISRPGKSWNSSEGHGKSFVSKYAKEKTFEKITDKS